MIDPAEVKDPSPGVQRAALMLSQEDSTEATCYGWVPQARRALLAAVTVEEVADALARKDGWNSVAEAKAYGQGKHVRFVEDAEAVVIAIVGAGQ